MHVQKIEWYIIKLGASSNRDLYRNERRRICVVDRDVENEKPTNQRQDEECVKDNSMSIIPNNFYPIL